MKGHPKTVSIPNVGVFPTMKAACEHENISYPGLTSRLRTGYYLDEAIAKRKALAAGIPLKSCHYTVGTFASFASENHACDFLQIPSSVFHSRLSIHYYGNAHLEFTKQSVNAIRTMWPARSVS